MADPSISVIIVNWNGRTLLRDCLASLEQQTTLLAEIIVVDNGSTDNSVEWLQATHPDVKVVRLTENRGFAAGCNAGIAVATGSLIATLNNDTIADPRWLGALSLELCGRPDVGMVASRMVRRDQPDVVDSTGICLDVTAVAWDRRVGESAAVSEPPTEIFGPCAGAALYRRELFDDVGLFDEDFFMFLEDVDLAWRARLAGWRCVYAPDARVLHWHSATAVENSPFKLFHLARNRVWTVVKNYPSPDVYFRLPAILLFDLGSILSTLLYPRRGATAWSARLATLRGRLFALRQIGVALKKRRAIQNRRRVPLWRWRSELEPIVWLQDPFGFRSRLDQSSAVANQPTETSRPTPIHDGDDGTAALGAQHSG